MTDQFAAKLAAVKDAIGDGREGFYTIQITFLSELIRRYEAATKQEWIDCANEQGYWWHWTGDPDLRPFMYHVQVSKSGRPDRYFIDYPDSRWCDEVGGKWMKISSPAPPVVEEAAGKDDCECGHLFSQHWPESNDEYKLTRCSNLGCDCEHYKPVEAATPETDESAVKKIHPQAVCLDCHEVAGDYNIYSDGSGSSEHLGNGASTKKAWSNARQFLTPPVAAREEK